MKLLHEFFVSKLPVGTNALYRSSNYGGKLIKDTDACKPFQKALRNYSLKTPINVPVEVHITLMFVTSKYFVRDLDNYDSKHLFDALQKTNILQNDSLVVKKISEKKPVNKTSQEGVFISIYEHKEVESWFKKLNISKIIKKKLDLFFKKLDQ